MTAGSRINDGRKVHGKIVGVAASVILGKRKGDFQRNLGRPDDLTVLPGLTVNRDFTTGSNRVQERLAIASKSCSERRSAGKQWNAFPIGYRHLVDSTLFSDLYGAKQVLPAGVGSPSV